MPNHVTNKLLFHPCTEKRFNEILADLQKEGAEPGSIDLGRIIPEPEGLFMGDLGVEEMKKYKDNNWYDWRMKNWNTKWNAYGFEVPTYSGDTGTMTFLTANCSPFRVLFKLSEKYPDVEFELRYADEDLGYNVGEISFIAGELIDDNSPREGTAAAQELAADILGIDLTFDVNSASGYVLSLLAMDDGRSCILAERQYSLASHLGVAQELQSHILVVLGCFRVGQNLGHLLIVLAAQHELHVMECLLAEQGKCLGGDFHYLLALEFANAHSFLCEQAVLGVVFAHLEHGGVLEIRCCHN